MRPAPALLAALLLAPPARAAEGADHGAARDGASGEAAAPDEGEAPLVQEPVLVHFEEATYPPGALAAGLEATVGLEIEIDERGEVVDVRVVRPAGHGFDEAAVEAARRFRFEPARDERGPVPVVVDFDYGFVLDRARDAGEHAAEGAAAVEGATGAVDGLVLEMGTRRPLPGVPVRVELSGGRAVEARTGPDGRFRIDGVPAGGARLVLADPGHLPVSRPVDVPAGGALELRLWMRARSYLESEQEIVATYRRRDEEVARHAITVEEVRRVPGTFGDPVRVVQSLPGAARSPFGTGMLVIRGANPEDSAVYVDGVRLPLIYHLGGYRSVIAADLVESVDYLPGSYGVRYGRSTGGLVDVRTRRDWPERRRVRWSTDLLDSGGVFVGRVGPRTGVAAAARRSYVDLLLGAGRDGFVARPRWTDYQLTVARTDARGREDGLALSLFGFEDRLLLATPEDFAQGTDPATQGDLDTGYGSHHLLLRWERAAGERWRVRLWPSLNLDTAHLLLGSDVQLDQRQVWGQLRAEAAWRRDDQLEVAGGLDFIGGTARFSATLPWGPDLAANYDPIAEREPWTLEGSGALVSPEPYLEARWRPLRDPDRLLVRPGLRLDAAVLTMSGRDAPTWGPEVALDPRVTVRWGLVPGGALELAAGVYRQPPLPFELWTDEGSSPLTFERARSVEVGWSQAAGPVTADLSLFAKALDHLAVPDPEWDGTGAAYVDTGVGRVRGLELIVRHAATGPFFGWLSYTLSRAERNANPEGEQDPGDAIFPGDPPQGEWVPFEFDQTHILTVVASWALPRDLTVSGRFQYVTGNPYTPYAGGVYDVDQDAWWPWAAGGYDSERMPDFLALDLRVERLFTFRAWQLDVYLDLLNAVRGTNPEMALYNYDYTEHTWIRGLPFIPSPGFEARFEF